MSRELGRMTWQPVGGGTAYSEIINDNTPSKIAAANARAAAALSTTVAGLERIDNHGQRKGNHSGDKLK